MWPRLPVCASVFALVVSTPAPAAAQSLFIAQGERAAEGSVGWSVGAFANGVEVEGRVSLDGRWDIGFGVNRYVADFGGADDTTLVEWSPSVRYSLFKEQDDGTPVSVSAHAALFQGNYEGGGEAYYVLAGGQLVKRFALNDTVALYPALGFSLAFESSSVGVGDGRALSLTRQLGVHALFTLAADAWLRVTAEEHAFRRETYRAARVAYVRRF